MTSPTALLRKWREQFLAAGAERLQGRQERTEADELRRQIGRLERALGRKTLEVEVAGNSNPSPRRHRAQTTQGAPAATTPASSAATQLLLAITRDEVLRHPGIVLTAPDGALCNGHTWRRKRSAGAGTFGTANGAVPVALGGCP
jgi:hypothetical protein